MAVASETRPQYSPAIVEQVILEIAAELLPRRLTIRELSLEIVAKPDDKREVDTAIQAIHSLKQSGLFTYRDGDGAVELTPAARRAVFLLT